MDGTFSFYEGPSRQNVRTPLIAGPYSRPFLIDPAEYTAALGVRFKPGAGRMFYPFPMDDLHNVDIPLNDLFPGEGEKLLEDLCAARVPAAQFRVIERYLIRRIGSRCARTHPAVQYALQEFIHNPGMKTIFDVRSKTGLSHTRFIQLFREAVGLTPKLFSRIQRFQAVLRQIEQETPLDWADVALERGYVDQAHLIHDFRAFAGMTPLDYVEQQASTRMLVSVDARG
jgi:AraC-like DNA-binding protein